MCCLFHATLKHFCCWVLLGGGAWSRNNVDIVMFTIKWTMLFMGRPNKIHLVCFIMSQLEDSRYICLQWTQLTQKHFLIRAAACYFYFCINDLKLASVYYVFIYQKELCGRMWAYLPQTIKSCVLVCLLMTIQEEQVDYIRKMKFLRGEGLTVI